MLTANDSWLAIGRNPRDRDDISGTPLPAFRVPFASFQDEGKYGVMLARGHLENAIRREEKSNLLIKVNVLRRGRLKVILSFRRVY
jgi:hypothetical protein